jgi:hypothetical protein
MPLSQLDHAALLECLALGERHPEIGRAPPDDDSSWRERAEWSCYVLQYRNLNCRPWEAVPSEVDLDGTDERGADARALLRRMLAMGLSKFDPNPSQALQFA